MKYNKFFLIIFLLIAHDLFAQHAQPNATLMIDKAVQKYHALSSFSIDFTLNEEGKEMQNGVLFVKNEKYYLSLYDQVIANDGHVMWNYQENANEASIFDAEEKAFSIFHPSKILNNWREEYSAKYIREENFQNKIVNIIDLTAPQKTTYYKIRLFLDRNCYFQQVELYEHSNIKITYTINKFSPNAVIEDAKFSFNKNDYPDVQINDMR